MKDPGIYSNKRKSGLKLIGDLDWGSHLCQFFQTEKDLADIVVPFFKAGLAGNECCMWAIPDDWNPEKAKAILRKRFRRFDEFVKKGQIEIVLYSEWSHAGKKLEKSVVAAIDKAVRNGFDGLRYVSHAAHSSKEFKQVAAFIGRYNLIGLYAYPRDDFDATSLIEMVNRHRYALLRNAGQWEVIESSEARIVKDALDRSEQRLQLLFHNMSEAFAYHRLVTDADGKPCNYIFLEANEAFERLTGLRLKSIIGKRATDVLPGIESDPTDWIGRYGEVALTGKPLQFESYSEQLGKWYSCSAFSPYRGFFAVTFDDMTERKRAEEEIRRHSALVEGINRILNATLTCATERELGAVCLDVAEKLTQSKFGFIGQLFEDGTRNIAMSYPGWDAFRISNPALGGFGHHGIDGGVMAEGKGFFTNDVAHHPNGAGLPKGHPPIDSFLGVPLIHERKTIGVLALANRPNGYTIAEQKALEALAPAVVEAFMRHRAELELRKAHDELDQKVRERTEELRKVNSVLRMVSECNQILVHAADETQLVGEICRIIVEMGAYRMAWVGYAEDDSEKSVRAIASMELEKEFLDNVRVSWGDNPLGRGPTGSCIRTGKVQFGRNYLEDPDLAPWREQARKSGFMSSIALPLLSGTATFGALAIYSELPDAFNENTSILRELADDLAFGIMTLRAKQERDQARQAAEKRAEQLRALAVELVQAEQKERRQLARILHDHLQQILVGAKFGASLIRTKSKENKEIERASEELIETIDEAIRASRSLSADLSPPVLHEKGLAAGLRWLGRQMQEKHGLTVDIDADVSLEPDSEQIRQFLFDSVRELLLNAAKYAQATALKVGMRRIRAGGLEITVEDDGIGFDPAKLEAADSTIGGFGLFSIRERLSYLQGEMTIDAAPGKGSRFVLMVPTRITAQQPSAAQPVPNGGPEMLGSGGHAGGRGSAVGKITVLLADDHPVLRHGLSKLLDEQPDIRVVGEAGDGRKVIELARQLKPDIILMDVGLPIIDGFEATRRIVKDCPQTRIIGLSMHEEPEMAATMVDAGASAYLTKGGPIEHLITVIRSCRLDNYFSAKAQAAKRHQ